MTNPLFGPRKNLSGKTAEQAERYEFLLGGGTIEKTLHVGWKTKELKPFTVWKDARGLHRELGPAVDSPDHKEYWFNGSLHRLDSGWTLWRKTEKGVQFYYHQHGKLHRENGPAIVVGQFGSEEDNIIRHPVHQEAWFLDGKKHRLDGPAVSEGEKAMWCNMGTYHREDGPAIVLPGEKIWALYGKTYKQEDWFLEDLEKLQDPALRAKMENIIKQNPNWWRKYYPNGYDPVADKAAKVSKQQDTKEQDEFFGKTVGMEKQSKAADKIHNKQVLSPEAVTAAIAAASKKSFLRKFLG